MNKSEYIESIRGSYDYHKWSARHNLITGAGEFAFAGFMGAAALGGAVMRSPILAVAGAGIGIFSARLGYEDLTDAQGDQARACEFKVKLSELAKDEEF